LGFHAVRPPGTWVYKDETSTATITTYTVTPGAVRSNRNRIYRDFSDANTREPACSGVTVLPAPWPTADNSNVVLIGCAYTVPGFALLVLTLYDMAPVPHGPFTSAGGVM